jgi:hypothetical protein
MEESKSSQLDAVIGEGVDTAVTADGTNVEQPTAVTPDENVVPAEDPAKRAVMDKLTFVDQSRFDEEEFIQFLMGYPDTVDDPNQDLNVLFYRNEISFRSSDGELSIDLTYRPRSQALAPKDLELIRKEHRQYSLSMPT